MKGKMKKLFALALAAIMVLAMGITASAKEVAANVNPKGTASITITNAKKGVTYKVYQVFKATETGSSENDDLKIAYSLLDGQTKENLPPTTGLIADVNGNVTANNKTVNDLTPEQVIALKAYAESLNQVVATGEADGDALVFTGLQFGYYMVVRDAVGDSNAAVSINSTTPDMEIVDKNPSAPTPVDPEKGPKQADNDLVAVGEEAHYTVEFNTTNYETIKNEETNVTTTTKIYQYVIKDVTEGEFLDDITVDSVKIYQNGKPEAGEGDPEGTITLTPVPEYVDNVMTIDWTQGGTKDGAHLYKDGSILEIKYHGTVNSKVKPGEGNTNKVEIGWNDSTTKIPGEDDIYTASITIDKVNGAAEDKTATTAKLQGAKFVILDSAVSLDGVIPTTAKYYTVDDEGKIGTADVKNLDKNADGTYKWPESAVKVTDDSGEASFTGLKPNTIYYLLEVEAPKGFNRLVPTTEIVIGAAGNATEIEDLKATKQIENNAGALLPSTGGIGTTIFYVVGGILVVVAGVLLITKKRMSGRD